MLLNFTKKWSVDLTALVPRPNLLRHPYDRCISRLKYKPDLFLFCKGAETLEELHALKLPERSWDQLCEERARELLALGKDHYYLYYSGGIDSTVALVSMLKFWPDDARRRIVLWMSHSSVLENPRLFQRLAANFRVESAFGDPWRALQSGNNLFLSGDLGDQMFGSDILLAVIRRFGEPALHDDYRKYAPIVMGGQKELTPAGEEIFRRLEPIVAECPFPVRTTHQFFWWYNFTQKWQYVKYRFAELESWDLRGRYGSHIQHFFDSPGFQLWALRNPDLKIKDTWNSYKFPAKDFIHSFTRDPEDLKLEKQQSLGKLYSLTFKRIAITEDYREIRTNEELRPYVRQDL